VTNRKFISLEVLIEYRGDRYVQPISLGEWMRITSDPM